MRLKSLSSFLGATAVAVLCFSSLAEAAVVLNPVQDTEIRYGNTADRSTFDFTNTKNAGDTNGVTRKSYFEFDISTLTEPVTAASTLKFFLSSGTGTDDYDGGDNVLSVFGLTDETLDAWDDTAITYNTDTGGKVVAPANGTAAAPAGGDTLDLTKAVLIGDWDIPNSPNPTVDNLPVGLEVSYTGQDLADFLNADTNGLATFILVRTAGSNSAANFSVGTTERSEASGLRPVLTAVSVPEPSSLAVLAIGGVSVLVRRRK